MGFTLWMSLVAVPLAWAEPSWEATLDIAAQAVVSLRVSATRAFDTEEASTSVGTGFIIDAERGLILTNRHLVQAGPVVAEAVFLNHEEVSLEPIYRDPVHDFGLFRFDPEAVRFMDVVELPLNPDGAHVGAEIRIVGNDAGEKLSILSGTLARLDRAAPIYGHGYNDFNTFYLQAASSTSGGSSGSPVLNIEGQVIALNAGGAKRAASSYYLPLGRVVRAVEAIQAGEPVSRGSLQTRFLYTPYDELRRLGLQGGTEAEVRETFPDAVGMLVVRETVPGGPADGQLLAGDVLVRLNGALLTSFQPLEAVLDDSVGGQVTVAIERGGASRELTLDVSDLHALSAASYVEVGGGVIHALSYQQARNHTVPVEGLYVASPGYMLSAADIPDGALIRAIGGEPVATLDALWDDLLGRGDRERVAVRYAHITRPEREQVTVVTIDRRWFPLRRCVRDDTTGGWPCESAPAAAVAATLEPATTTMSATGSRAAQVLAPSLVMVEFDVPYRVEGLWGSSFRGAGLVVDAEQGLLLTDRDTVPVSLGDVTLTFGGSVRIPGRVVWVHPEHNVSLVSYDPALLGATPVRSATLLPTSLEHGDEVHLVALTGQQQVVSRTTRVSRVDPILLPLPDPPQHRDVNLDVLQIDDSISSVGGVLADKKGRVLALWASFHRDDGDGAGATFRGLPVEALSLLPAPFPGGQPEPLRLLGAELRLVRMADARELGLPQDRADALEAHDPDRKQVLSVSRLYGGFPAADVLQGGDLVLTANGLPVTRFLELERAAQAPSVRLEVLRDGAVETVDVETRTTTGQGIDRAIVWAGALLHEPHPQVAYQRGRPAEGVYVSWYWYGTPAYRYGLRATRRIVAVNDVPTPDLDAFLAAVVDQGTGEAVRIQTKGLDDQIQVITLKADLDYWPTRELRLGEGGWAIVE